jgi:hypothetical protein
LENTPIYEKVKEKEKLSKDFKTLTFFKGYRKKNGKFNK